MATLEQLEKALVNADKAGDMDAARRLAAAITEARKDVANLIPDTQVQGTFAVASEPPLGEKALGAGEAALTMATGATGGAVGGLLGAIRGLGSNIVHGQYGTQEGVRNMEQSMQQGAAMGTYAPRGAAGQEIVQDVGTVLQNALPAIPSVGAGVSPIAAMRPAAQMIGGAAGNVARRIAAPVAEAAGVAQKASPELPTSAAVTPAAQAAQSSATFSEIGTLANKASSSMPGSSSAKAKLADMAQVNPEAKAAAERLGMDLPFDVFSDNPQIRAAVGLTRSAVGSEAEAAWTNSVRNAVGAADDVVKQFDAAFVEGRPAPGATSQKILDSLNATQKILGEDASKMYQNIDAQVPKETPVSMDTLRSTLGKIQEEVGAAGFTKQERQLATMMEQNPTYGRLIREKNLIGQAMAGKESPYGSLDSASLKRLYAALAEDQLANVAKVGGEELRKELRAANLLTAKKKALENRIVSAFGKEADGSVGNLMRSAISSASKGDSAQFTKLMKVVPPELRKETVATAIAANSVSNRAGNPGAFGFAEYTKMYQGLRANPQVYKQVVDVMGKDADGVMRDLYEVSKRITDARAQVLTTGKANQALVESMKADGLIGKVMGSTMAQRAVSGAASIVPGGAFMAPDIVRFMANGGRDAVKAAGKLFASDEFQKLAIEAATKEDVQTTTLRNVAKSKDFSKLASQARIPGNLNDRMQWLKSSMYQGNTGF